MLILVLFLFSSVNGTNAILCHDTTNECWRGNETECVYPNYTSQSGIKTVAGEPCAQSNCKAGTTWGGVSCYIRTSGNKSLYGFCYPDCNNVITGDTDWENLDCYDTEKTCFNAHIDKCTNNKYIYRGRIATDLSNKTCLKWTNTGTSLKGNFIGVNVLFTFEFVGDHNYCRNINLASSTGVPSCFIKEAGLEPCFKKCPVITTTQQRGTSQHKTMASPTTTESSFATSEYDLAKLSAQGNQNPSAAIVSDAITSKSTSTSTKSKSSSYVASIDPTTVIVHKTTTAKGTGILSVVFFTKSFKSTNQHQQTINKQKTILSNLLPGKSSSWLVYNTNSSEGLATIIPMSSSTGSDGVSCIYATWKSRPLCRDCNNSFNPSTKKSKKCSPMSPILQIIARVVSAFGCTWILGTAVSSLVVITLMQ